MVTLYQVAEMRKLRAYAQMDKQKAVKEVEERLKKEHAHEIASLRTLLRNGGSYHAQQDGAPKQVWPMIVEMYKSLQISIVCIHVFHRST